MEAPYEGHYSRNSRCSVDRVTCGVRAIHEFPRHDLATRCEFSEGCYDERAEGCEETHGQQQKEASLQAHEFKCAAWSRQFIQSCSFYYQGRRNAEVLITVVTFLRGGLSAITGGQPHFSAPSATRVLEGGL